MFTETNAGSGGVLNMKTSRNSGHTLNDNGGPSFPSYAYTIGGGSSAVDKFDLNAETMMAAGSCPNSSISGVDVASAEGEFYGYGGQSTTWQKLNFTNETWSSFSQPGSNDGWGKGLSSKHGWGYFMSQGNCGTGMTKFNDISGTHIVGLTRAGNQSGEENFQMGQNVGYCIGAYYNTAGGQTNESFKIDYLTDTMSQPANIAPKGHDGASSGSCASRAAS